MVAPVPTVSSTPLARNGPLASSLTPTEPLTTRLFFFSHSPSDPNKTNSSAAEAVPGPIHRGINPTSPTASQPPPIRFVACSLRPVPHSQPDAVLCEAPTPLCGEGSLPALLREGPTPPARPAMGPGLGECLHGPNEVFSCRHHSEWETPIWGTRVDLYAEGPS